MLTHTHTHKHKTLALQQAINNKHNSCVINYLHELPGVEFLHVLRVFLVHQ